MHDNESIREELVFQLYEAELGLSYAHHCKANHKEIAFSEGLVAGIRTLAAALLVDKTLLEYLK